MGVKRYIFCLIFCCVFCRCSYAKFPDLYDFYYEVHVDLKERRGLIKMLSQFVSKSEISSTINELRLIKEQKKRVHHAPILKERIQDAVDVLNRKAHEFGFFNSKVSYEIKRVSDKKLRVDLHVDLGKLFKLKTEIIYARSGDFSDEERRLKRKARFLKASIKDMTELAKSALRNLQKIGYYRPELTTQRVRVDYEKNIAILKLVVNPGERVTFGDVKIKSFERIDDKFIRNRLQWKRGELFDIEQVESSVESLRSTQIFSTVKIKPSKESAFLKNSNEVPMEVAVGEDKKNLIDVSVLYSGMRNMNFDKSSRVRKDLKSIIARVSWTRFNAFNGGEQLRIAVEGTPLKANSKRADYAFEVTLSQPDVFVRDNTVDYEVSKRQELTNAFFRKIDRYDFMCSYPIRKDILVRAGAGVHSVYVDAEDDLISLHDDDKRYKSITFPVECVVDRTDNSLNPTRGYRFGLKLSGSIFHGLRLKHLFRSEENFSYNVPLDRERKNVFSVNLTHKILFNAKLQDIPIDQRIYCGGIGSVRGYANQMATEIYKNMQCPAGGKSSFEFNLEARRRFNKDFGGVLFFDGAKVFQNNLKELPVDKRRWFFSVGAGVRYFTGIGPMRFDFAFPINRRKDIDSKMQFIMSLGQTF